MDDFVRHPPKQGTRLVPSPEISELREWGLREGALIPKLDYPVRFEPGYIGSQATEEIGPSEPIVTIPKHLIFRASLMDDSELSIIAKEHPELFESDPDCNFNRLVVLMLYEHTKGRDSFWCYFLAALSKETSGLTVWTDTELSQLQDPMLECEAKTRLLHLRAKWQSLRKVLVQYPQFFTPDTLTFDDFMWVNYHIETRSFGKRMPCASLCPLADLINHSNSDTYYFFGPASALSPLEKTEDDYDQPPADFRSFWPVTLEELARMVRVTEKLRDLSFAQLAGTARSYEHQNFDRVKTSAWKQTEFETTEGHIFRVLSGPKEIYCKGAEICLNYGAYSNRDLLLYFGFALSINRYNYEHVFVPRSALLLGEKQIAFAQEAAMKEKWCFKVREREVCMQLIRTIRVLHWRAKAHSLLACFRPSNLDLEIETLTASIDVLRSVLASYPTSLEEDENLQKSATDIRFIFAIEYRRQRKLAVAVQIRLIESLLEVIHALKNETSFSEATAALEGRTHEPLKLNFKSMLAAYLNELEAINS